MRIIDLVQQTAFGTFAPMPNAQIVRLPYELIRDPRGSSKESIKDMMRKRKKVEFARWPVRAGIIKVGNNTTKGLHSVNEGDEIKYQIVGIDPSGETNALQRKYDADKTTAGYQVQTGTGNADAFNYRPHGVDDVDSLTTSIRENIDNNILEDLLKMISHPNLCSRKWIWEQYDHMVILTIYQYGHILSMLI